MAERVSVQLQSPILSSDNTVRFFVEMDPSSDIKRFKVSATSSQGRASIWNEVLNRWVPQNDLWTQMPTLTEVLKVKIPESLIGRTDVVLSIVDLVTGKKYSLDSLSVWGRKDFEEYIRSVNEMILSDPSFKEEAVATEVLKPQPNVLPVKYERHAGFIYIAFAAFFVAFMFGVFKKQIMEELHGITSLHTILE